MAQTLQGQKRVLQLLGTFTLEVAPPIFLLSRSFFSEPELNRVQPTVQMLESFLAWLIVISESV